MFSISNVELKLAIVLRAARRVPPNTRNVQTWWWEVLSADGW